MEIDKKIVKYIGDLARIELKEEDLQYYAPQLTKIFNYVEKINELDLDGVEATYNVLGSKDVMDEDEPRIFKDIDRILEIFPKREGRFIKIRKVI